MNDIKIKLMELGKKQVDLVPELKRRGIEVYPSQISIYLKGAFKGAKYKKTIAAIYEIIEMWEAEAAMRKRWE